MQAIQNPENAFNALAAKQQAVNTREMFILPMPSKAMLVKKKPILALNFTGKVDSNSPIPNKGAKIAPILLFKPNGLIQADV